MFTGIVEDVGTIAAAEAAGSGRRMTIATKLDGIRPGDSVSVDGCCLTATRVGAESFDADLSKETLDRTTLGALAKGSRVNLERAVGAGQRLGGHIVSGHVDGVGSIESIARDGESSVVTFACDRALLPFLAGKGSVAVNGVSLTVNGVTERGFFVTLVPFTLSHTTFGTLAAGSRVNLEIDVIARYVLRGLEAILGKKLPGGITDFGSGA